VAATECVGLLRGRRGQCLDGSSANSFFYLFTALHGVHVLGGLWFWGRTTARPGRADVSRVRPSVELCTVYWRYLLLGGWCCLPFSFLP